MHVHTAILQVHRRPKRAAPTWKQLKNKNCCQKYRFSEFFIVYIHIVVYFEYIFCILPTKYAPITTYSGCLPTICILYSNVEYVPFENKCRNNQMDDNIFDKRLLKRNCFMINKHFNRHYIWIVINVILSKASPVFQEKNQYMYLCLFCMLKSMLTLERVKSHILLSA